MVGIEKTILFFNFEQAAAWFSAFRSLS